MAEELHQEPKEALTPEKNKEPKDLIPHKTIIGVAIYVKTHMLQPDGKCMPGASYSDVVPLTYSLNGTNPELMHKEGLNLAHQIKEVCDDRQNKS